MPACNTLARQAKQAAREAARPSAQEMAKLRRYAKCMREHGAPNWPDPDSDGNFNVPPELRDSGSRGAPHAACKQYEPPLRPK